MSSRGAGREHGQAAFVLHSYPFRETSLVVELFTHGKGRIGVVARGARRARSTLRGILLAFQPLLVSWSGKTELQTLHKAEWQGGYAPLRGRSLICGFYINELLLKMLVRHDPHEALFDAYEGTLRLLAGQCDHAAVLRGFEQILLGELGYALLLRQDAESGHPIAADRHYFYVAERGPVELRGEAPAGGVKLSGQTLLDMQSGDYSRSTTQLESKALMRMLINHHLGNQVLHTRQLLLELQQL